MTKVLITGGCGFIGSHIIDALLVEGCDVTAVDNLATGKLNNIANKNVTFIESDILDSDFETIVKKVRPEFIIHQAAQASVPHSIKDIFYDAEINIKGSLNVIEAARKHGVKKIVFASSAAVYGNPEYLPIDLNHPIKPTSPYGVSKYSVELYLQMAEQLYGLDYTILRYANVYGPRQDARGEGGVIAIFHDQLMKGETPVIYGDGKQTRDFIYVEDVAEANVRALTHGTKGIFNVSTERKTSINELIKLMAEITGRPIEPLYLEERQGDIKQSILSNEWTKKSLHWSPKYSLKEGLKKMFTYNDHHL